MVSGHSSPDNSPLPRTLNILASGALELVASYKRYRPAMPAKRYVLYFFDDISILSGEQVMPSCPRRRRNLAYSQLLSI